MHNWSIDYVYSPGKSAAGDVELIGKERDSCTAGAWPYIVAGIVLSNDSGWIQLDPSRPAPQVDFVRVRSLRGHPCLGESIDFNLYGFGRRRLGCTTLDIQSPATFMGEDLNAVVLHIRWGPSIENLVLWEACALGGLARIDASAEVPGELLYSG